MRILANRIPFIHPGWLLIWMGCFSACQSGSDQPAKDVPEQFITVLGIAQDAGYPQAGCQQSCCADYHTGKASKKMVTCLALVDKTRGQYWLLEATPDIGEQLYQLQTRTGIPAGTAPSGILITHAHIGHYTGLMYLGREAMGATSVPVYVLPRLDSFLRQNGPWSQLVKLDNIRLNPLQADSSFRLGDAFTVTAIQVPHRDEFSETAGFIISNGRKKVLFIPDIDKWEKWDRDINALIRESDVAFLDATFYRNGELPGRDMREIPHPFVSESLQRFSSLSSADKAKIVFIHFNHTNPLLQLNSPEKDELTGAGYRVAAEGMLIGL